MDESDLLCSLCHKLYSKPKMLFCHHSFCKSCLVKYWKKNKHMVCPICSEVTSVPDDNIHNLEDSLLIEIFVNETQTFFKGKKYTVCTNCNEKKTAIKACVDCALLLCADCFKGHQIIRNHREKHTLFDIELLTNKDNWKEFQKHRYHICDDHKEPEKLFCSQDKEQLCHMCAFSDDHKDHTVEPLTQVMEKSKKQLATTNSKLKDFKNMVINNQKDIEKLVTIIKSSKSECLKQIFKQKQLMIQMIEITCRNLEDKVKATAKEGIHNLQEKMNKNNNVLQSLKEKQNKSEVLDLISASSRLDATMLLTQEIEKRLLHIKMEKMEVEDQKYVMQFVPVNGTSLEEILSMGKLQVLLDEKDKTTTTDNSSKDSESQNNEELASGNEPSPTEIPTENLLTKPQKGDDDPRKHLPVKDLGASLHLGDKVVRGPGWNSGSDDVKAYSFGIVQEVIEHFHGCYTVSVKWKDQEESMPHTMNIYSAVYELQLA